MKRHAVVVCNVILDDWALRQGQDLVDLADNQRAIEIEGHIPIWLKDREIHGAIVISHRMIQSMLLGVVEPTETYCLG